MSLSRTLWLRRLKAAARPLLKTPLHPQWLAAIGGGGLQAWVAAIPPGGRVLDVGCAGQGVRAGVPASCHYIGLDYPATAGAYGTRPMVYADAHVLPFNDRSMEAVLLTDVLEHLGDPERALSEMRRVLKPGGRLVLRVPFLYPVHDAPDDYTRWTEAGLRSLAARSGFAVTAVDYSGEPIESGALLFNLALAHSAAMAVRERRLGALLAPLVPVLVLVVNLAGYALARLFGANPVMPYAYASMWTRPA